MFRYLGLLKAAVDPQQFGRGLYFSYSVILTLPTERMVAAAGKEDIEASWKLEDARFFWNRHLMKPLSGNSVDQGFT